MISMQNLDYIEGEFKVYLPTFITSTLLEKKEYQKGIDWIWSTRKKFESQNKFVFQVDYLEMNKWWEHEQQVKTTIYPYLW